MKAVRNCFIGIAVIFLALVGPVPVPFLLLSVASETQILLAGEAQSYFDQGLNAYYADQLLEAIRLWELALSLFADPAKKAETLGNLAVAYQETGQYFKALEANQTALEMFLGLDQARAVGKNYNNLGNVYEALGDYDSAIAAYQQSLQTAQGVEDRAGEGIAIGNIGHVHALRGNQAAALENYEKSLAIAREISDRQSESYQLLNIGLAHHALRDFAKAAEFYQLSLEIAQEIGDTPIQVGALGNLGLAAADANQPNTAIAYFQRALSLSEGLQNPSLAMMTRNNLGHTLLAEKRLEEAEKHLRDAISSLETLRSGLDDAFNVSVFDTQIYSYNLLQQVLVAKGEHEAALEISEAGRARAFAQLVEGRLKDPSTAVPEGSSSELITINKIRQTARQQNVTIVEYSLVPEEEFRVQGKQRGRTAEIHIWVVQPDGTITFRSSKISSEEQQLEALLEISRSAIGARSRASIEIVGNAPTNAAQSLTELHRILIDPIQDLLPKNPEEEVVFVPQGSLFLVPFPALMSETGDYLIQRHTILSVPSIQILELTRRQSEMLGSSKSEDVKTALVVGNPTMPTVWNPQSQKTEVLSSLLGAEREAVTIAQFLKTEPLIADAASELNVREQIGNARIVHLATHGLLEYGNPQDSGVRDTPGAIALAPDATQDGLLTSTEILELRLKAELVVLSACDTGRGDITGDGVIGLSRSLVAVGVPSVVVSLWAVPDAPTAELMVEFYKALDSGQNKAQALRQAMLKTMISNPNPKDWAAFTLIGASQ